MTQETTGQNPSSQTVADQADSVANHLTTRRRAKKHGSYNLYEDDRIRICLDTHVPNIDIHIPAGEKWTTVFAATYRSIDRPQVFRPGRWMEYLAQLHLKALEVRAERDAERERKQAEEQEWRYGPVDDADVYTDIPAATGPN